MTSYSPYTEFLKGISERLKPADIPVFFKLPSPEVSEPFYVIGTHFDDDSQSAKIGTAIINTTLQIDLFYPADSRTAVEEMIWKTKALLNNRGQLTSDIRIDNSIGREVYHVIFQLSDLVI